jgi:hypothetical protein
VALDADEMVRTSTRRALPVAHDPTQGAAAPGRGPAAGDAAQQQQGSRLGLGGSGDSQGRTERRVRRRVAAQAVAAAAMTGEGVAAVAAAEAADPGAGDVVLVVEDASESVTVSMGTTGSAASAASAISVQEQEVVPQFVCPITSEVMQDPVIASDGQVPATLQIKQTSRRVKGVARGWEVSTGRNEGEWVGGSHCDDAAAPATQVYEREAIERWLQVRGTSPLTGVRLESRRLYACHPLRQLIHESQRLNTQRAPPGT